MGDFIPDHFNYKNKIVQINFPKFQPDFLMITWKTIPN